MKAYLRNAQRRGHRSTHRMNIFIMLSEKIQGFPFGVISNFTSGRAYEYNMRMLQAFSED